MGRVVVLLRWAQRNQPQASSKGKEASQALEAGVRVEGEAGAMRGQALWNVGNL